MIPTTQSAVAASLALPPPVSILYPGNTSRAIAVPVGAVGMAIETYAPGQNGGVDEVAYYGGQGGGYSRKNRISTSGVSALYLAFSAETSTTVRQNNAGGTVLCAALRGNNAAGTGDVKFNGGEGGFSNNMFVGGGGAGGPNGNGGPGNTSSAGANGGGPYGYGTGGSGTDDPTPGAPGCAVVTWFFE